MTANTSGPVGKKILTYRCTRAGSSTINRCAGASYAISVTVLDKAVWTAITYLFSDPKRIRAVLETQLTLQSDEERREVARKQAIEGQLHQVSLQIENATRAVLGAANEETHALWTQQIELLVPQRKALEKELVDASQAGVHRKAAYEYLQSIEDWCKALGPEIQQASYEERRYLLRGLKTKVTCFKTGHDPRFVIEWDLARLQEPLRDLLPHLTDKDITALYESNNTYFRHQSADYVPGSGFVTIRLAGDEVGTVAGPTSEQ